MLFIIGLAGLAPHRRSQLSSNVRPHKMPRSWFALISKATALLCVAAAIGAVFFASTEQLTSNGGVRNSGGGDIFRGITGMLGETGARLLVGSLLMGMAVLFWRLPDESENVEKHSGKLEPPQKRKRR